MYIGKLTPIMGAKMLMDTHEYAWIFSIILYFRKFSRIL